MPFSFKQFHIDDRRCGMPVSTDGVLLGAWAPLTDSRRILDIGAGSGLLSLMAAQRSPAVITAVELDPNAVLDCQHNFSLSPWSDRLTVLSSAIQEYCHAKQKHRFDHIICNPPYFDNGPQSSCALRAAARHTDSLGFNELLSAIAFLLHPNGQASLILPSAAAAQLLPLLAQFKLRCCHRVKVSSVQGKPPKRELLLIDAQTAQAACVSETLAIRSADGRYTEAFTQLSQHFYLKL
ncbi:methyltransferase [Shewanella sp.]|nr:methyltransferase [Shewanella sp.]